MRITATTRNSPSAIIRSSLQAVDSFSNAFDEVKHLRKSYEASGLKLDPGAFKKRLAVQETFRINDKHLKQTTISKFSSLGVQVTDKLKLPRKIELDEVTTYAHAATAVL